MVYILASFFFGATVAAVSVYYTCMEIMETRLNEQHSKSWHWGRIQGKREAEQGRAHDFYNSNFQGRAEVFSEGGQWASEGRAAPAAVE